MTLDSPTHVLEISSAETGATKRSAGDDLSPNGKRRAKDTETDSRATPQTPALDERASTKLVESLTPPKAPKKISLYMRFKSLLLKESKEKGDTDTVKGIATIAKKAWAAIKDDDTTNVETDSKDRHRALKAMAERDEKKDLDNYKADIDKFKEQFCDAAISFLHWKTKSANEDNVQTFEAAINMVDTKATAAWGGSSKPDAYVKVLSTATTKLETMKKNVAIQNLTETLKGATDKQLHEHVIAHVELLNQVQKMTEMEKELSIFRKQQEAQKEKDEMSALSIKDEICRGLHKQMVYTNPSLKHKKKSISFTRQGVSKHMFAKAFGIPEGTVKFTFSGNDVGSKSLRYSSLWCDEVNVRLSGETLTASSKYGFD